MLVRVRTPCLGTCIKELNEPRYMSVRGIEECFGKPLTVMTYETLKSHPLIDASTIGLRGSPSNIYKSFTPPQKGDGVMLEGNGRETADKLATLLCSKLRHRSVQKRVGLLRTARGQNDAHHL